MKKKNYVLSVIFFCVLFFLTYWWVFRNYHITDIINSLKMCDYRYLILALLCVVVYLFCEAYYLKRTIRIYNKDVSIIRCLGYVFTEVYFSAMTPSSIGGQPVQMLEMKKDGIKVHESGIIVLLNTFLFKLGFMSIAVILFCFYYKDIFFISKFFLFLIILGFVITILLVTFFWFLLYSEKGCKIIKNICFAFINKFSKKKEFSKKKIEDMLESYHEASLLTLKYKKLFFLLFLVLTIQKLAILSVNYFIFLAFGLKNYSYFKILSYYAAVTMASDIVPTPGGVMASEGLSLLVSNIIYGEQLAISAMLLERTFSFYGLVLVSSIIYLIFHYKKRAKCKIIKDVM